MNRRDTPPIRLRTMEPADVPAACALWRNTPGMGLDPQMDSAEAIAAYLRRNPGLSAIALDGATDSAASAETLAGTVLAGTDGRRGYLMHLAVREDCRRRGIARALVEHALAALREAGIHKTHIFVFQNNQPGTAFWRAMGWQTRDDLLMFSMISD